MAMLNVAQSVALDYYEEQTKKLLGETNHYTQMLVNRGRLGRGETVLKELVYHSPFPV